ncbi:hypothetical protein GCM10010521_31690 [Streptomyces rameus]|uniref:Secreted protein n=1 Tax=Streptomyces rameus TaxID=68261 RepID=A0ABP6NBC2_9ACTN
MFRGTTARTVLALLGVTLLTLQLFAPTGPFAPAHTSGQALAKAETGTASFVQAVRERTETAHTPGRPGEPAGIPHVRDRHRGPASSGAQHHPLISVPAAGADPARPSGAPHRHAPGTPRARTAAALQVFRC